MAPNRTGPHLAELRETTISRAGECGFFFDFDGTLAPIQDDPETVAPVPGAREALADLTRAFGRVAVVSARPVHFLQRHFSDLPRIDLFGLYGLEYQIGSDPVITHPDALAVEPIMKGLADAALAALPEQILVEYKRLAVSLHYRAAPQLREVVEQWAQDQAGQLGLRIQPGRMVVELKPPGDRDKGSVIAELIAGLSCAWYFGDDLSDLRAFAAIENRMATDSGFCGTRVAVANPESGSALRANADLCLDHPAQVPELLSYLTDGLPGR